MIVLILCVPRSTPRMVFVGMFGCKVWSFDYKRGWWRRVRALSGKTQSGLQTMEAAFDVAACRAERQVRAPLPVLVRR